MSRRLLPLFVFLLIFPFGTVFADSSVKIATINLQEALNKVDQGKKAKEDLKKEFDAKQKKLDLQQDELKKFQEDLMKQRLVLSEDTLRKKEEEFNKKYLELQQNFANYRQEIAQKEALFTAEIIKNLKKICGEIGKKEGYLLITEISQDAILYAEAKDDVTEQVVKEYNRRFKGSLNQK